MNRAVYLIGFICLQYAAPVLSLSDADIAKFQTSGSVNGVLSTVLVEVDPDDSDYIIVQSNGLPNHEVRGASRITTQSNNWRIPRYPVAASSTTCLPLGAIGMATNGVAIFNQFTSGCLDAGSEEVTSFDRCWGHPTGVGVYHYHVNPRCIYDIYCNTPSEIIGVALDGFPIYGPIDETGNQVTPDDLDECNGRTDLSGQYKYHVTNQAPYFLGCFKGEVTIRTACRCQSTTENRRRRKRQTEYTPFACCSEDEECSTVYNTQARGGRGRRSRRSVRGRE